MILAETLDLWRPPSRFDRNQPFPINALRPSFTTLPPSLSPSSAVCLGLHMSYILMGYSTLSPVFPDRAGSRGFERWEKKIVETHFSKLLLSEVRGLPKAMQG